MPVPVVIDSDVDGGPLLGSNGSELYDIYKAHAAALGWTIAFDDDVAKKIVLHNPSGQGFYYRIHDTGGENAEVQIYDSMTDIDTGNLLGTRFHGKRDGSMGGTRFIVASDGKSINFFGGSASNDVFWFVSFGDAATLFPGSQRRQFLGMPNIGPTSSTVTASMARLGGHGEGIGLIFPDRDGFASSSSLFSHLMSTQTTDGVWSNISGDIIGEPILSSPLLVAANNELPSGKLRGAVKIHNGPLPSGGAEVMSTIQTPAGVSDCLVIRVTPQFRSYNMDGTVALDVNSDWDLYDAS